MNEISLRERNFASAGDEINLDGAINHGRPSSGGNWTVFRHAGASLSDGDSWRTTWLLLVWNSSPPIFSRKTISELQLKVCDWPSSRALLTTAISGRRRSAFQVFGQKRSGAIGALRWERWTRVARRVRAPYVKRWVGSGEEGGGG